MKLSARSDSICIIIEISSLSEIPIISSAPKDAVGELRMTATFTCSVDAIPPAVVTWKKDGAALSNSSRVVVTSSSCVIKNVKQSDIGFYRCIAMNEFGIVSARASLVIIGITELVN